MRPNLFIVGAAKSGTTSLHSYLAPHPQVFMSQIKEPHYFCTDFHRSSDALHSDNTNFPIRSEKSYLKLFDGACDEPIVGEASASYLYSAEAAENIALFNPDAKIVICLRSPAQLLRSWHSYLLFCLEEDIESFSLALEAEDRRRASEDLSGKLPTNLRYPERLYYSAVAALTEQVQRYFDYFPRQQIHFVVLEEMKIDTQAIYSRLLDFLEVSPFELGQFKVENARSVRKSRTITYLQREWITPLVKSSKPKVLSRILPGSVKKAGYRTIEKLNIGLDRINRSDNVAYEASEVDEAALLELHSTLRHDVEKLAELVQNPNLLSLWGYD